MSKSFFLELDRSSDSSYHCFSNSDQDLIDQFDRVQSTSGNEIVGCGSLPILKVNSAGVSASIIGLKKEFRLNFEHGEMARRVAQGSETLCRVTGASRGEVISIHDATAGLGRESVLMASCGARVSASERSLALYLLAKDALNRSKVQCDLYQKNSLDHEVQSDVIYLDPMFPKSKKKAAVGREALILRAFAQQESTEESSLLEWALDNAVCRVVVKRPLKSEFLAKKTPTSSVKGKAIRFDIYGKRKLPKA